MPPKQRITREMILESAFDMFCREGMDVINARSVAKALNCSTQPIFSYYTGMQELKQTLDAKAQEMFADQVAATPRSDTWLIDLACAYVRFACEKPCIHRHLFDCASKDPSRAAAYAQLGQEVVAHVAQAEGVSEERARMLCEEMGVYASGLAAVCMIRSGEYGDVRAKIERAYQALLSITA